MADYYTEFSFVIEKVTQAEGEWLATAFSSGHFKDEDGEDSKYTECFDVVIQEDPETHAWIHSGDSQPRLDALFNFLQKFLAKFRPSEEIFFEWGYSCSKRHTDGFGGGAALIRAKKFATANTQDLMSMLQQKIDKEE